MGVARPCAVAGSVPGCGALAGSFTMKVDDSELQTRSLGNSCQSRERPSLQASTSRMTVSMLKASRSSRALLAMKSRSNRIVPVNLLVR